MITNRPENVTHSHTHHLSQPVILFRAFPHGNRRWRARLRADLLNVLLNALSQPPLSINTTLMSPFHLTSDHHDDLLALWRALQRSVQRDPRTLNDSTLKQSTVEKDHRLLHRFFPVCKMPLNLLLAFRSLCLMVFFFFHDGDVAIS